MGGGWWEVERGRDEGGQTHIRCALNWMAGGSEEGWRMGGSEPGESGGRREQGEGVRKQWCEGRWEREYRKGGRVEEGNEWGRNRTRHGRSKGKRGREEASGGGREQQSEGEEQGRSVAGREIGREGNFKGGTPRRTLANIQDTVHKTTHNAALVLETLVLQMKNSEQV